MILYDIPVLETKKRLLYIHRILFRNLRSFLGSREKPRKGQIYSKKRYKPWSYTNHTDLVWVDDRLRVLVLE